MANRVHIPRSAIDAVRRLDVAWAHEFMTKERGYPFVPGPSDVTGKHYTADENALIAVHRLRTKLGTKAQVRASKNWLRSEGLNGMFEAELGDN